MVKLNEFNEVFARLKSASGTHSPSIETLQSELPDLKIKIDACFLSNPYATELFMSRLQKDFQTISGLRDLLEFYPPQNRDIAKKIASSANVEDKFVFVGNGAIEIISAVLKRFCGSKIFLPIPTFSSYYEFIREDQEIHLHQLDERNDFRIDASEIESELKKSRADSLILINPNNPNGSFLQEKDLINMLGKLKHLKCIIIDESFVHFAYDESDFSLLSHTHLLKEFSNVVVVKSMSKDFGIAGIRSGYALMSEDRVENLLSNDYLWNSSGLSAYFFSLFEDDSFLSEYDIVRKKYIMNCQMFYKMMSNIEGIKVYPSKANFLLIRVENDDDGLFGRKLLVNHGIYVRDCQDKIGLPSGGYYRVACRSFEENVKIIDAIKDEAGTF